MKQTKKNTQKKTYNPHKHTSTFYVKSLLLRLDTMVFASM